MSDPKKISQESKDTEEPTISIGLIVIGVLCLLIGVGTGLLISLR